MLSHAAVSCGVVALELGTCEGEEGALTLRYTQHLARPGKTWLLGAKCSWDMRLPYRLSLGREVREGREDVKNCEKMTERSQMHTDVTWFDNLI